MVHRSFCCFST